jgi:hypothetical protein
MNVHLYWSLGTHIILGTNRFAHEKTVVLLILILLLHDGCDSGSAAEGDVGFQIATFSASRLCIR